MASDLQVSVWRGKETGAFTTYAVPRRESQTVLDVVTYIQRHLEPSLGYRFACRVGMCGSCAMTVNGQARWTCRTHVAQVAQDGQGRDQGRVVSPHAPHSVSSLPPEGAGRPWGGPAAGRVNESEFSHVGAQARRWYWQRISAMVLALCVLAHLGVMIYAVRGGLSAAEILGRTRGNAWFAALYTVFVLACAVHVPVGLANIAVEWLRLRERSALWLARGFGVILLALGLRAVYAVVLS